MEIVKGLVFIFGMTYLVGMIIYVVFDMVKNK